jgi:hypothetical protein
LAVDLLVYAANSFGSLLLATQAKQREMAENAWTVCRGVSSPLSTGNSQDHHHPSKSILARRSLGSDFRPFCWTVLWSVLWWGFEMFPRTRRVIMKELTTLMQVLYGFFWLFWELEVMGRSWLIQDKELMLFLRTRYQGFTLCTCWPFSAGSFFEKERTAQHRFRWPTSKSVNKTRWMDGKDYYAISEKSWICKPGTNLNQPTML